MSHQRYSAHLSQRLPGVLHRPAGGTDQLLVIGYIVFGVAAAVALGLLAYWTFARTARHRSRRARRW